MRGDSAPSEVAYLGPPGTFTERAARLRFPDAVLHPTSVTGTLLGVKERRFAYGIVPVENSSAGVVESTLDAVCRTGSIQICDEAYLPIRHQLLSQAPKLADVRHIHSHSQALRQCADHIAAFEREVGHSIKQHPEESTSAAALEVRGKADCAAIASIEAAALYAMPILRHDIQDRPDNTTRFWSFGLTRPVPTGDDKTALLVELDHRPGTLQELLGLFARRGVNLLSLHTRPIATRKRAGRWEYAFILEFSGHIREEPLRAIYALLKHEAGSGRSSIMREGRPVPRLLGSYPNRL